jgi:hypothetical protein
MHLPLKAKLEVLEDLMPIFGFCQKTAYIILYKLKSFFEWYPLAKVSTCRY